MATPAINVQNLTKNYGPVLAVDDCQLPGAARRTRRVPRPQRGRQVHLHAHPHHLAAGVQRVRLARRLRRDVPVDGGPQAHRLPARERAAVPRDAGPRIPARTGPSSRASSGTAAPPASTTAWRSAASRRCRTGSSARSRRATGSASGWPTPCSPTRPSSSSTSRPAASTRCRSARRSNTIRELGGQHTVLLSTHILPRSRRCASGSSSSTRGRIKFDDTHEVDRRPRSRRW